MDFDLEQLPTLPFRELQHLAKTHGIKANQTSEAMQAQLTDLFSQHAGGQQGEASSSSDGQMDDREDGHHVKFSTADEAVPGALDSALSALSIGDTPARVKHAGRTPFISREALSSLKYNQLRSLAKEVGTPARGKAVDIVEAILAAQAKADDAESPADASESESSSAAMSTPGAVLQSGLQNGPQAATPAVALPAGVTPEAFVPMQSLHEDSDGDAAASADESDCESTRKVLFAEEATAEVGAAEPAPLLLRGDGDGGCESAEEEDFDVAERDSEDEMAPVLVSDAGSSGAGAGDSFVEGGDSFKGDDMDADDADGSSSSGDYSALIEEFDDELEEGEIREFNAPSATAAAADAAAATAALVAAETAAAQLTAAAAAGAASVDAAPAAAAAAPAAAEITAAAAAGAASIDEAPAAAAAAADGDAERLDALVAATHYLSWADGPRGRRVRCAATGHETVPRLADVAAYLAAPRTRRAVAAFEAAEAAAAAKENAAPAAAARSPAAAAKGAAAPAKLRGVPTPAGRRKVFGASPSPAAPSAPLTRRIQWTYDAAAPPQASP
ncbi:hypothetical protein JKP88DRAFT_338059 [Tribonema minus]|uniref:Uncharacterized protein n=1 Tax=Tribonema minus TaxID=303371 RepID=A0A835YIB8_9STRA|nr:hypothetical protein JKP88DRAFT_338059 [Tribonema minus]